MKHAFFYFKKIYRNLEIVHFSTSLLLNNDKIMKAMVNKPSLLQQSHLIFTTRCKFSHIYLRDLRVDFSVYLLFIFLVCLTLYFQSELHHFNDIPKHTSASDNCCCNYYAFCFIITLRMENCAKLLMQSRGSLNLR